MNVTPSDLRAGGFDRQLDALDEVVRAHRDGEGPNVAVVADPFAGRDLLVDYAREQFDGPTTMALDGLTDDRDPPELAARDPSDAVVVLDCHYLYAREIGGFDRLDRFLESIALSTPTVVTGWNSHAWRYLDAVRDVGDAFDRVVRVPAVDALDLAGLIEAHHDGPLPSFVETDADGRVKTLSFERGSVSLWGDRELPVPAADLNTEYLLSNDGDGDLAALEAVVYEKLAQVSAGNPGVATTIWSESVRDGEIAPAYVPEYERTLDLADDTAFVLELVVANERVRRGALDGIRDGVAVDQVLERLSDRGLVAVDGNVARIAPHYWRETVDHLEGRQLVW